jgi:hypothetical protein
MKTTILILGIVVTIALISGCVQSTEYDPIINSSNFISIVDNPYFNLVPGNYTYQTMKPKDTDEETEIIVTMVTNKTKKILDITTVEVWDRVWLDNELIEETFDWYAQDKDGNVWYFGEDSKEYENGKVVSTKGSWEAGKNGAKPGIIMKANPKVGNSYRQEYYKGEAEDMADVISLGETVTVPFGTFTNCLKTRDWSRIDSASREYKYYCPEVGNVVLEVMVYGGKRVELINVVRK